VKSRPSTPKRKLRQLIDYALDMPSGWIAFRAKDAPSDFTCFEINGMRHFRDAVIVGRDFNGYRPPAPDAAAPPLPPSDSATARLQAALAKKATIH
jgi:hypothetical protein